MTLVFTPLMVIIVVIKLLEEHIILTSFLMQKQAYLSGENDIRDALVTQQIISNAQLFPNIFELLAQIIRAF